MHFSDLCKELNKFIRGETPLSTIKDCFSLYWTSIYGKGEPENNIVKVELLHIAVEAYEAGHFSGEDLRKTILHYSSGVNHHQHKVNEDRTKSHG